MALIEIATKTEFDELLKSHTYVAVQAFATWCGPCKAITPFFCANAKRYDHVSEKYAFVRFDTDEVPELAQELGIRSIPRFFAFENGERTDSLSGANPPALQKFLDRMGEKVDSLAAANPPDVQRIRDQIGGQAGHTHEEDNNTW